MEIKTITEAAAAHRVTRNNHMWSWGGYAHDRKTITLFAWIRDTEVRGTTLYVDVLARHDVDDIGGRERRDHLIEIDAGKPGYVLLGYRRVSGGGKWVIDARDVMVRYPVLDVLRPDASGTRWAMLGGRATYCPTVVEATVAA